ncbi:MAG: glycosyltransferase family 4 protein [Fibrobacter sp.]|nr:glycosyltransferase family 4 protein [Fibrobacter sp.]
MKILITIDFPPENGGIQRYLLNIVKHTYSPCDIVVAGCSNVPRDHRSILDCKVQYLSTFLSKFNKKFSLIPIFLWLLKSAAKKNNDICFEAGNLYSAIPVFLLSYIFSVRYSVYCYGKELFVLSKRGFRANLFGNILKRADKIYYLSSYTLSLLKNAGITGKLIQEPPRIELPVNINKNRNPLSASLVNLLTVGRLVSHKGHSVLIKAAQMLSPEINWHLTIAGSGPELKPLLASVKESNLLNRISIQTDLSDLQISNLYSSCDIFLFPSLETADGAEGFGIVLLEAMAYHLPIIASRTGAIPEVLSNGECGILVEPDNPREICSAVMKLITDESLQKTLITNASARLRKYYAWK